MGIPALLAEATAASMFHIGLSTIICPEEPLLEMQDAGWKCFSTWRKLHAWSGSNLEKQERLRQKAKAVREAKKAEEMADGSESYRQKRKVHHCSVKAMEVDEGRIRHRKKVDQLPDEVSDDESSEGEQNSNW